MSIKKTPQEAAKRKITLLSVAELMLDIQKRYEAEPELAVELEKEIAEMIKAYSLTIDELVDLDCIISGRSKELSGLK